MIQYRHGQVAIENVPLNRTAICEYQKKQVKYDGTLSEAASWMRNRLHMEGIPNEGSTKTLEISRTIRAALKGLVDDLDQPERIAQQAAKYLKELRTAS